MSKMITEIEKPKCCKDCVWYQADKWFGGSCGVSKEENGWNKRIEADEEYDVQKWCPLLPKNDVIPVEWLRKYMDSLPDGSMAYECILVMLERWGKENESNL